MSFNERRFFSQQGKKTKEDVGLSGIFNSAMGKMPHQTNKIQSLFNECRFFSQQGKKTKEGVGLSRIFNTAVGKICLIKTVKKAEKRHLLLYLSKFQRLSLRP